MKARIIPETSACAELEISIRWTCGICISITKAGGAANMTGHRKPLG